MALAISTQLRSSLALLLSLLLLPTAAETRTLNGFDLSKALVPVEEIMRGGPPRDGIPAIDKPVFVSFRNAGFLKPDDRVLGIVLSGTARAYPIKILNWHEIVNDAIGNVHFAITYCPLCGTGVAFSADIRGRNHVFGVSGLLYNSDVLLYDRKTESLWSQIMGQAVSGPLKGHRLEMLPLQHTTWRDWIRKYPDSTVLSTKTGFARDYDRNPYAGYERSTRLYFDVSHTPPGTYHPKERVLGLQAGKVFKAYPFVELNSYGKTEFKDSVNGRQFTIFWDSESQSGTVHDDTGKTVPIIQAFWFAWYTFHPDTIVFEAKPEQ